MVESSHGLLLHHVNAVIFPPPWTLFTFRKKHPSDGFILKGHTGYWLLPSKQLDSSGGRDAWSVNHMSCTDPVILWYKNEQQRHRGSFRQSGVSGNRQRWVTGLFIYFFHLYSQSAAQWCWWKWSPHMQIFYPIKQLYSNKFRPLHHTGCFFHICSKEILHCKTFDLGHDVMSYFIMQLQKCWLHVKPLLGVVCIAYSWVWVTSIFGSKQVD